MKNLLKCLSEKWQMRARWSDLAPAERKKGSLIIAAVVVIGGGAIVLPWMVNSHPNVNTSALTVAAKNENADSVAQQNDDDWVSFEEMFTEDNSPNKKSDTTTGQSVTTTQTSSSTDKGKKNKEDKYTVAQVIDGYLDDDPMVASSWYSIGDGWIEVDGKGSYYPGAVYDGDWKDVTAVLQSYRDKSQPWVETRSEPSDMAIWTKGYKHQFIIEDDWLTLDYIKVMPVVEKTYDLNPDTLIEHYQSGKWGGEKLYSTDYWTTAIINRQFGFIDYNYSRQLAEDYDYNRGKSYNAIHHELVYRSKETHGPAYKDWDVIIDREIEESYFNVEVGGAYSNQYVDLPGGRIDEEIIDSWYCDDGTFFILNNEIRLYKKGKLITSWSGFTLTDDAFLMISEKEESPSVQFMTDTPDGFLTINEGEERFFYTNNEVFFLQKDGALKKLMTNIFYVYDSYEGSIAFAALNDGVVTYGSNQYFNDPFRIVEIERDVTDAIGEMGRIFMKKADGTARIWDTNGDEYKEYVTYLLDGQEARSWLKGTEFNYTDEERVDRFKTFMKDIIKAEKAAEEVE